MEEKKYLECERWHIFLMLIFVGGCFGAYTFNLKGGVFCNAQTANIVLLGLSIGSQNFTRALFLLIPLTAYFAGTMVSEVIALRIKKYQVLRWDTVLVGIELIAVLILSFLPANTPNYVFQITINFLCAMQFNTFRQARGVGMATTFITNHVRQTGSFLVRWIRKKEERKYLVRSMKHFGMIFSFFLGATIGTVCCEAFNTKALLLAGVVLLMIFIDLAHADLTFEKDLLNQVPSGH